jgi:hypothetical protein
MPRFLDKSFTQQYRDTRRVMDNMGTKIATRIDETQRLSAAVETGDWVERDNILIARSGRSIERWIKFATIPVLLCLFFGFWAFVMAATALWWRCYCIQRRIREIMGDWPREEMHISAAIRNTAMAAILIVFVMFIYQGKPEFWAVVGTGVVTLLGMGAYVWATFHSYGNQLAQENPTIDADEIAWEAETAPAYTEPGVVDALAQETTIYGFTKTIPRVFDGPERYPAGVELTDKERFRHTYVIGKTMSGKSYFLRNVICQDIKNGFGVVVLTHERVMFQDYIMPYYPRERMDDLIYYNPADTQGKIIGFNLFALGEGENPSFKSGEIYTVFERTLDDLGASMKPILQNAIDALVYMRAGKTLRDLEALIDPEVPTVRREVLRSANVSDRTKRFWGSYEDSTTARTGFQPLLHRLRPLLEEPLLTTLSMASFNVNEELNRHARVLCIDLSGLQGSQQRMVGQLVIALLRETFYARDVQSKEQDFLPYYWYIDEFQQYAGHSEAALLEVFNGLRKYQIGLTIAHQTTANLSQELIKTIMGNVGTVGAMRLQESEAQYFARELQVKEVREHHGKKKETAEDVRAKYREVYLSNHPQRASMLKALHNKMDRLQQEEYLNRDETEDLEHDPTVKLRPDLFLEEHMPQGHIILRGVKNAPFTKGALYLQVPVEPVGVAREAIFAYEDYVMHSQEKYGQEVVTTPSTPSPGAAEDEYLIPRQR